MICPSLDKSQWKHPMEKKSSFQEIVLKELDIHMQKKKKKAMNLHNSKTLIQDGSQTYM